MDRQTNLVGHTLNERYVLESLLGQGGMGAVYKATDRQMAGRIVAVKVLAPHLVSDEKQVKRFEQEARAANQLRHPNTISVLDFGRSAEGHIFMVIEFLTGETLTRVMHPGAMDISRALYIMRQVCKSLAEAHSKGIVHRDLKPDNIFVCEIYGEKDFVKVIDFGIAKFLEDEHANLTQAGKMFGTPRYLSPEQAQGIQLDNRSDLYSLGVILFEMLVGRAPFVAEEAIAVAIKHVQEAPPTLAEVNPDVRIPDEVDRLVFKLLAKKPDQRFQKAEDVVAAIDNSMVGLQGGPFKSGAYTPAHAMTPARPVQVPDEIDATRAMATVLDGDGEEATMALDLVAARAGQIAEGATVALDHISAPGLGNENKTLAMDSDAATRLVAEGRASTPRAGKASASRGRTHTESSGLRNLLLLLIVAVLAVGAIVVSKAAGEQDPPAVVRPVTTAVVPTQTRTAAKTAVAAANGHAIPAHQDQASEPAAAGGDSKAAARDAESAAAVAVPPPAVPAHAVTIESTPPGATVHMNGMPVGKTPHVLKLAADDPNRTLKLTLDGYKDYELPIKARTLVDARIDKLPVELERNKPRAAPTRKKKIDFTF